MCIRDRAGGDRFGQPVECVVVAQRHDVQPGIGRVNDQFRSCLLYTSDAADERSSVDLGGRRIIKKKKQRSKKNEEAIHGTRLDHTHI